MTWVPGESERQMEVAYSIQEAAHETGLSEHTLRYYERVGLIEPVERAENGHRRYSPGDLGWIEFLKCLRATGMPVTQMKAYADLARQGDQTVGSRLDLLEQHRCAVLRQIEELQQYLAVLDHKIDYYSHEKERLEQ
jgi:DNA-binding transcriptional MerR regulator